MSGIMLSKAFNRQSSESERYAMENRNQIRLQVRQAMSGQVFFAVVHVLISSVPAVIYLVAGLLLDADAGGRSRLARSWRSRPCRRGCCSR